MDKGTELKGVLGHVNKDTAKELKALEELRECGTHFWVADRTEKDCKIIKQALQRLEAIENSNPSKALEDFNILLDVYIPHYVAYGNTGWVSQIVNSINQALNKAQENEEILSVIKEKHLFECTYTYKHIIDLSEDYATYCKLFESFELDETNKLIESEFILLKTYFEKKYVKIIAKNVKRGA